MNIYLVRHTEYANPEKIFAFNLPMFLTENGRAHAKRIGEWFKTKKISIPIISTHSKTDTFVSLDS